MSNDPFEPLATARLLLRCVAAEDAPSTSTLMTPEVSRWVAYWPVPFTHEMAVKRIQAARDAAANGNALPFAVTKRSSGELMGWVMINRNCDGGKRGSFGYWLGEKHQGRGYIRELAPAVLAAGFQLLNLDVIEAAALPDNIASLAVLRGCGMTVIGERMVYTPTRQRDELVRFHEIWRPC